MLKTRCFPEHNYKATFFDGETLRFAIDPQQPIGELEYPEFYDIKITNKCPGKCNFCYQDSKKDDSHYENVVEKVNKFFGAMTENQRPFQVAIGGGEPTLHPDFIKILKAFHELGIMPNYTTNGMWKDKIFSKRHRLLKGTKEYCGGVAVSCHPHLKNYWEWASMAYNNMEIMLNFHIIISDKESIDYFSGIYDKWNEKVKCFVLLPYTALGRAEPKEIDWDYLVTKLPSDVSKIAFGANFYPYLQKTPEIDVNLYEPEIMSKFISLEGSGKMYKSSFGNEIIKENFLL
jgi:hypothetical protein